MSSQNALLIETISLISEQLLLDSTFCGSPAGRRLRDLRRTLVGTPPNDQPSDQPADPRDQQPIERHEYVSSTLVLPLALDTALSAASDKTGRTRYTLIEQAISTMIAASQKA